MSSLHVFNRDNDTDPGYALCLDEAGLEVVAFVTDYRTAQVIAGFPGLAEHLWEDRRAAEEQYWAESEL